jgi:sulfate adenylyltransferase subunit 2|tara:strand:- start:1093 stop:2595 length:1503 start_codon:yes stop_codon:yes gene_type:complete
MLLGLDDDRVWNTEIAFEHLKELGEADTKRTAERRLHELLVLPPALKADTLKDELNRSLNQVVLSWALEKSRGQRKLVLFVQLYTWPNGRIALHANDARGGRYWVPLRNDGDPAFQTSESINDVTVEKSKLNQTQTETLQALNRLQEHLDKDIAVFPHGALVGLLREPPQTTQVALNAHITLHPNAYPPILTLHENVRERSPLTPHLKRLEAESIHIIREAIAEAENPVMLYSLGKDSSVMLHLARKAFYPAPPPFPLAHIDTRWKFQEMYLFRKHMARVSGMELMVHINPEAIEKNINPFDHGSALHTDITKTEGLKQLLNQHQFDVIFGGARRDEEKSRAKERIFSFRTANHRWDPKEQRPELWNLYNNKISKGESLRVFPLSNWTELDIWQYIHHEQIPVVPLYFAKKRPVVVRNGMLLMVDDSRFRILPDEEIVEKSVRFRTLGCYPLTGAIESTASNLPEIILELIHARNSERQGRAIDSDASASMEKKKQEGYF